MSSLNDQNQSRVEEEWLAQLRQLHQADKAKRSGTDQQNQKAEKQRDLLQRTRAYQLMREVQKYFLNGGGLLDASEGVGRYDRAITLVWQGPISQARRPNSKDPDDYFSIQVGLRSGDLWVNDRRTSATTSDELRHHLLKACQKPAHLDRSKSKYTERI